MNSINTVVIGGNLTRDPVVREAQSGVTVANITVAVNEGFGDKKKVAFVDVTAFKHPAKFLGDYCAKGDYVAVEGRLSMDSWDDKQTGQTRSKLVVIASRVTAQSRADKEQQHTERTAAKQEAPQQAAPQGGNIPF